MKKLILLFTLIISSYAFSWSTLVGMFKKTVDTLSYTIDTSGYNPRVYEFDTQGYPRMHCVVLFRNDTRTAPAMQCVPTNEKYIKINKKIEENN
jgi:endo-1,4-beta-D-glucanase Y